MNTETRIIIIAGTIVVCTSLIAGILTEELIMGFSAIAFAILFHAIASATE